MTSRASLYTLLICVTVASGACRKLPILAIRLRDTDATNQSPITAAEIATWVDTANIAWTKRGYKFTFDASKDFHTASSTILNTQEPSTAYDNVANLLGWLVDSQRRRIIVLFRARGGGGWSWGPPTSYVSMPSFTNTSIGKPSAGSPNYTLLSHEVGHYLGLAHTFPGFACEGNTPPCNACTVVTLANADADAGGQVTGTDDDIGDTPADPRADCAATTSLTCPGGSVTVNAQTFNPPWNNVMTYHDCMPEELTADQARAVKKTLEHANRQNIGK